MNEDLFIGHECVINSAYSFNTKRVSFCLILEAFYCGNRLYTFTQCFPTRGKEAAATCKWPDSIKYNNVRCSINTLQLTSIATKYYSSHLASVHKYVENIGLFSSTMSDPPFRPYAGIRRTVAGFS
jgi:hypothetical protein